MYINDIDERVTSGILKFADDTKIYTCVQTVEAAMILQEDLNRLCSWSKDWLMLFNVDKCKCLHFGFNNIEFEYMLGNDTISSCLEEKDLGITVHHSLQTSSHCANIVKKANQVLGIIRRTYDDKSKENIVQLYKSLVRPHLEYCVQAWRPYLQKDIDNIEKVQRRATKMINGLSQLSYEERLKRTNLMTLELRRLRADLLEKSIR